MKTATSHHHPASSNNHRHVAKPSHRQSPRNRTATPAAPNKPQPATIKVAATVDQFGDIIGLAAGRPDEMRQPDEVEKTITVAFDEPSRWRLCFAKFADLPEWRPSHVLEMPPTLRGASDETFHEGLPFLESREDAMRECAKHNSSTPHDGRWAFVVEFGRTPKNTISLLVEFASDSLGVETPFSHRVVRMVAPTAAERGEFDDMKVAENLPVTGGDPAKFRVYGIAVAKHRFRKWAGDFDTAAEAREAAAGFKADRADDDKLAFVVVSPGPLPGVDELRQMAAKGAKGG